MTLTDHDKWVISAVTDKHPLSAFETHFATLLSTFVQSHGQSLRDALSQHQDADSEWTPALLQFCRSVIKSLSKHEIATNLKSKQIATRHLSDDLDLLLETDLHKHTSLVRLITALSTGLSGDQLWESVYQLITDYPDLAFFHIPAYKTFHSGRSRPDNGEVNVIPAVRAFDLDHHPDMAYWRGTINGDYREPVMVKECWRLGTTSSEGHLYSVLFPNLNLRHVPLYIHHETTSKTVAVTAGNQDRPMTRLFVKAKPTRLRHCSSVLVMLKALLGGLYGHRELWEYADHLHGHITPWNILMNRPNDGILTNLQHARRKRNLDYVPDWQADSIEPAILSHPGQAQDKPTAFPAQAAQMFASPLLMHVNSQFWMPQSYHTDLDSFFWTFFYLATHWNGPFSPPQTFSTGPYAGFYNKPDQSSAQARYDIMTIREDREAAIAHLKPAFKPYKVYITAWIDVVGLLACGIRKKSDGQYYRFITKLLEDMQAGLRQDHYTHLYRYVRGRFPPPRPAAA